jgi:hypothetical protein
MSEQQQTLGFLPTRGFWRDRPATGYQFVAILLAVILTFILGQILASLGLLTSPTSRYALAGVLGISLSYLGLGIAERMLRSKRK